MVTDLTKRLEAAQAELAAKQKEIDGLNAEIATAQTAASSQAAQIEVQASNRALEIVASQGIQPVIVPVNTTLAGDFQAAYKAETNPRKRARMLEENLSLAKKLATGKAA